MAGNIKQIMTSDEVIHDLEVDLTGYYDKTETDALLDAKADKTSVYNKSETDLLLSEKADKSDIYTKPQLDALFDSKANVNTVYTKGETDLLLSAKADASTTYSKTETDTLLLGKANLDSVYPKSDTYNRTQVQDLLSVKADADSVYTKSEVDTALADKANSSDVYTKAEADTLLGGKADTSTVTGLATTVAQLDGKVDLNYQNTAKLNSANTFEGALIVTDNNYKSTSADIDLTDTPSEATWGKGGYVVSDVNNTRIAYIQPLQNTDGSIDLRIDIDTNNNPNGRVLVNGHRVATTLEQFTVSGANLWPPSSGTSVVVPKSAWYQVGVSSGYVSTNPDVSGAIPKSCLVYGSGTTADYRNYFLEKGLTLYCTAGASHDLYELSTS